jgi:hypothetical protein
MPEVVAHFDTFDTFFAAAQQRLRDLEDNAAAGDGLLRMKAISPTTGFTRYEPEGKPARIIAVQALQYLEMFREMRVQVTVESVSKRSRMTWDYTGGFIVDEATSSA